MIKLYLPISGPKMFHFHNCFYIRERRNGWPPLINDYQISNFNDRVKVCLHKTRSARNKTSEIRNIIEANGFNLTILTEKWIKDNANDEFCLEQCCPNGYYSLCANRKEKIGGGLAVFYEGTLRVNKLLNKCFTLGKSMFYAFLEFTLGKSVNLLVCIYRRPNINVRVFKSELTSFFEEEAQWLKNSKIYSL